MPDPEVEYAVRAEHGEIIPRPSLELAQRTVDGIRSRGGPATLISRTVVRSDWAEDPRAEVMSLKWAEEVAVHGPGESRTVDIDVHVPGVKEPVPVELPLADARDLYAMLGRTIAAELGVRPDQI